MPEPYASTPFLPDKGAPQAAWLDRAVLVYGPRKGGTTLFQNLLDGGDQLLVYPDELKLKHFARHIRRTETVGAYFEWSRIPQVKSRHIDIATYTALWKAGLTARSRRPVGDLIRHDAWCVSQSTDRAPRRLTMWCAKEVGGGRHDILAFWRRLFPAGRALFIVREPHAVVRAILNDRRKKKRRLSAFRIAREVIEVLRTLRRQVRYLADPGVHFTVFEDLAADPEHEMRKVAKFLGIDWSPVLAQPTLFGDPVVVRTASQKTTGVFRPTDSWRDGLTDREQRIVDTVVRVAGKVPGLAVDYIDLRARIAARRPVTGVAP